MLSSQTKDAITAKAMMKLRDHGLNVPNILKTSPEDIEKLIYPVSFYKRKAVYILKTSATLHEKYNDDIPTTKKEVMDLTGVGPKMAQIVMNVAWNE
jgi:endonuclease-3